ncbi:hypothetical protein C8R47DRAFT_1212744 [Mycena vitilis]|nr:hypothetical protein C8R47DRAFT_1212744 [Mycena vitilis]
MDISTDHPTTPTDQPPPGSTSTDSSMTAAPQSPPTSSVPLKRPREEDDDGTAHKVQPRAVHTGQAMEKIAALEAENYALKEGLHLNESTLRSLNDKFEQAKEIIEASKIQHDSVAKTATEDLTSQVVQLTQAKLVLEEQIMDSDLLSRDLVACFGLSDDVAVSIGSRLLFVLSYLLVRSDRVGPLPVLLTEVDLARRPIRPALACHIAVWIGNRPPLVLFQRVHLPAQNPNGRLPRTLAVLTAREVRAFKNGDIGPENKRLAGLGNALRHAEEDSGRVRTTTFADPLAVVLEGSILADISHGREDLDTSSGRLL